MDTRIRNNSARRPAGFTLIETLIYLALFGLMVAGAFSTLAVLQESSERSQSEAIAIEEATFISDKIQNYIERGLPIPPENELSSNYSGSTTISYTQSKSGDYPLYITFSVTVPVIGGNQIPVVMRRTVYTTQQL